MGLRVAIQTKFNSDTALKAVFPDGCFVELATDEAFGSGKPVCVVTYLNSSNDYDTGNTYLATYPVQFTIYGLTDTDVLNAAMALKAAFDFCTLTISGATCLLVQRTGELAVRPDEDTYRIDIFFDVSVEESY